MYKTIKFETKDRVARITLNRPEVRNAFNWTMIEELFSVFEQVKADSNVRVVVLTGEGTCFCAGADLNWMKNVMTESFEENYKESLKLAELFYLIYSLPKPIIGRINGPAIGGGTGFVSVCDMAVASTNAKFSFSEVRIGLVPSDISPFMIRKCGEGKIREYFLTGRRLNADDALGIGLINRVVDEDKLDSAVQEIVDELIKGSPNALRVCKELLEKVPLQPFDKVREYTADTLANLRKSEEAQEGMKAFLEKRKPDWSK
ncbi:enoyl-CoA hydratase/isomerase family protein [candidate division WOR-3 bacterium]|nr:enoyl-CoA hydratase/isomerase family protein [candidate division WOR-3 bacterium]